MKYIDIVTVLIVTISKHQPHWYAVMKSKGHEYKQMRWAFYYELYHKHKLSITEIARACKKSRGAVKWALHHYPKRYLK